jgi:glycosyl hydrolase family 42 (putative beta-galactosidase)
MKQQVLFSGCLLTLLTGVIASASTIDMNSYKVKHKWGSFSVLKKMELLRVSSQFLIPAKNKSFSRNHFNYRKQYIEKNGSNVVLKGSGFFKRKITSGQDLSLNYDIEMSYNAEFYPSGKIKLKYSYINKGERIFFKPRVDVSINYALLKDQKWELQESNGKVFKSGKWPKKRRNALLSPLSLGGGLFKEAHLTKGIFQLSLPNPLVCSLPDSMQLRLIGAGIVQIYNYKYSSASRKPESNYRNYHHGWTSLPAGDDIVIEAEIFLPGASFEKNDIPKKQTTEMNKTKTQTGKCPGVPRKNKYLISSQRPVIKNGTFYSEGKPTFILGPWLDLLYENSKSKIPIKEFQNDRAYNNYFDYNIAAEKGFNTCHPMMLIWYTLQRMQPESKYLKYKSYVRGAKYFSTFIKNLKDMPLVVDFSSIGLNNKSVVEKFPKESMQQNPNWHDFVPFCPEHPVGKKVYMDFWEENTKLILKLGANPWIYELFNEPAYDCRCKYNKKMFIEWLKKRYGNLEECNKVWGGDFKSFDEMISSTVFERQKGLWVDWRKFIEDRWCEILLEGKSAIKKIDTRKDIYFSCQRAISKSFFTTCMGYDEYKIARVMDVVNTEGSIRFYEGKTFKSDDPMEAHNSGAMAKMLDCSRAAAEGKPVIDTEQSTKRFDEKGKRIPSKRSDLNLMLWNQAIHGSSLTMLYCWVKSQWGWPTKDLKGAKDFLHQPRRAWAQGTLLNPYAYPKGVLDGIKDFKEEIDKLSEIVMPRPRIKGTVALLLSNPTRRASNSIIDPFSNYYSSLAASHYPMDIIYEEQLSKGYAKKYKAVISPVCNYILPDTSKQLQEYVKNGGTLILQGMDLSFDEYGKPAANNSFIGLKTRVALDMPLPFSEKLDGISIKGSIGVKTTCSDAVILLESNRKLPLITCRKYGSGQICYISFKADKSSLTAVLEYLLKENGIEKQFSLKDKTSQRLSGVEVQEIDRGKSKLYYLVNWTRICELGILSIKLPQGEYTLTDPVDEKLLTAPDGNKIWNSEQLRKGVSLLLKSEEKVLLLITEKMPEYIEGKKTQEEINSEYMRVRKLDLKKVSDLKRRKKEAKESKTKKNSYLDTVKEKCFPIDISKQCNMAFKDEVAGDKKGGAFDQGYNDLREFPVGDVVLSNVPFKVIDPAENNGFSMIVLRGRKRAFLPKKAADILVNKKVKYLYFLHTIAWDSGKFAYIVNYHDGSKQEIFIHAGKEIGGWWKPAENKAVNAKIAWHGRNTLCPDIGAYCYRWKNPFPEKELKSIDIKSFNEDMVPGIIAITGESY